MLSILDVSFITVVSLGGMVSRGVIVSLTKQPSQLYSFEQLENVEKYVNRTTALKKDISRIIFIKPGYILHLPKKVLCIQSKNVEKRNN